jgi:hypothetical protein
MKFLTDPSVKRGIRDLIYDCFLDKDSVHRSAILTLSGLENYKGLIQIDQKLEAFTDDFYALLIENFEKELSFQNTHIIIFLEHIKANKWYKNEDDEKFIEQAIAQLEQAQVTTQTIRDQISKTSRLDESDNQLDEEQYNSIVKWLTKGKLVFILGREINLCGRQNDQAKEPKSWKPESGYPPSGRELAEYLARTCPIPYLGREEVRCPLREGRQLDRLEEQPELLVQKAVLTCPYSNQKLAVGIDLPYWSECIALHSGDEEVSERLSSLFQRKFTPTPLHTFLAELPTKLKNKGFPNPYQLIVTTNYDDVLEKTFESKQEPFDVLSYIAKGTSDKERGKFRHRTSEDLQKNRQGKVITKPKTDRNCSPENQTVILKIHGALDRTDGEDGFVITEDNYIDYVTRAEISSGIPSNIESKLKNSYLLFLGYDLSDWCMRAILDCIWKEARINPHQKSWAILFDAGKLDRKLWHRSNVDILNVSLEKFIAELNKRLEAIS